MNSINNPETRLLAIRRAYAAALEEMLQVFKHCPICGAELKDLTEPGDGIVTCLRHGDMVVSVEDGSLRLEWNSYWLETATEFLREA